MFKNNLKIIAQDKNKIDQLKYATSWEEKDILYTLINNFIPSKISDVIPNKDNSLEISWLDKAYFNELKENTVYNQIERKFNEYEIYLVWH